jgi:hypothetical protein
MLSMVESENVIYELTIVISLHVKKENRHDHENEVCINMHTQILNTICSQCKGFSESVLIIQNIRLPGKRDDSITEVRLQKIFRTPFLYTINIRL